jgi:hypothetical protein
VAGDTTTEGGAADGDGVERGAGVNSDIVFVLVSALLFALMFASIWALEKV